MTAPVLAYKKFYIIKPAEGTNLLKNPIFSPPDHEQDWIASGAGVTIEETGDEQRFGAYSMQVNTATGVASGAFYDNVTLTDDDDYTFSCYVKGTDGQAMRLTITDGSDLVKATTTFTATGYWQRKEVTWTSDGNYTDYRVQVIRDAVASTDPFYVDGVQFEQASAATTLIEGYMPGCRWEGYARNSSSIRSAQYRKGGEIVDLEDYCHVVQVTGLGHGDWNQILTKMTSGGDMYQTHTRKSRNFSIIVDFTGNSLSEIETNRKAVIDLIRPDLLTGQEMIVRYQGIDVNGNEATNPVDIVCVPLPATLVDTPDLPSYQRAVLNFTIPSGLLNGAYNEGKELNLYADFPADCIVKRSPSGDWYTWDTDHYDNSMNGQATTYNGLGGGIDLGYGPEGYVRCIVEAPDGKIYIGGNFTNAGDIAGANNIIRWNPFTGLWEKIITIGDENNVVNTLAFDSNDDLYVGGGFSDIGSGDGDNIIKLTGLNTPTPTIVTLGTGANGVVKSIVISSDGVVYIGGEFTSVGGAANTKGIAQWNGTSWSAVGTGITSSPGQVYCMAMSPDNNLYFGGWFTNVDGSNGDYLGYWDGTSLKRIGNVELDNAVHALAFGSTGYLYIGGEFTNAGGNANADYIAKWNGTSWSEVSGGTNGTVYSIAVFGGKLYASGLFALAGNTLVDNLAIWSNGAWQRMDIDLPGNHIAYAFMRSSDNSLYVGGRFMTGTTGQNAETGVVALNLNVSSASANTYPFMQVHGPGTLKAITNYTTGKSVMFDGLTLRPGEWINLYFDPLNLKFFSGWSGRGNLMRYVVPGSDYGDFYLMPGSNLLSLFMTDSTSASGAFMSWTPLFWGIDGALL